MNVLVINCGSSSLKYQLINSDTEDVLAKGLCERIGIDGRLVYQKAGCDKEITEAAMPTHKEAIQMVLDALVNDKTGAIKSLSEVNAVGHRIVHGGEKFASSVVITDEVLEAVAQCNSIVFFGGAGVSTESGIPDFRSTDGLYNQKYKYPPETIVSHSFYMQRTEEFYEFYKDKMLFPQAQPNAAHKKLAELEQAGKLKAVITQNIDGLHQAAGSKEVLELHGSVHRNYCTKCKKFFPLSYIVESKGIPTCDECGSIIKPDVVLYEEGLDQSILTRSINYIAKADMLIIGGTSLAVYPAAGLIDYFHGKYLVVINMASTPRDSYADIVINGKIGEVLSQIEV